MHPQLEQRCVREMITPDPHASAPELASSKKQSLRKSVQGLRNVQSLLKMFNRKQDATQKFCNHFSLPLLILHLTLPQPLLLRKIIAGNSAFH